MNLDAVGFDARTSFLSTDLNTGSLALKALIRIKTVLEEKTPPAKMILIFLLFSNEKVFTILIKGFFVWAC